VPWKQNKWVRASCPLSRNVKSGCMFFEVWHSDTIVTFMILNLSGSILERLPRFVIGNLRQKFSFLSEFNLDISKMYHKKI
jgi:hypothetical protein